MTVCEPEVLDVSNGREPASGLSAREISVLKFLAQGLTDKEIAVRIGMSIPTINRDVRIILEKLEVGSRTQAATRAIKLGLID